MQQAFMVEARAKFYDSSHVVKARLAKTEEGALAKFPLPPPHPFALKEQRLHWLYRFVEGDIVTEETRFDKEGNESTHVKSATLTERLTAMRLISELAGDLIHRVEGKVDHSSQDGSVIVVAVDNGRGPGLLGAPKATVGDIEEFEICPHCTEAIATKMFSGHVDDCPDKPAESPQEGGEG